VENFHRFNRLKHSTVNPKAFPEKGLYMLATILKSSQAVQATLAIIETFSKLLFAVPRRGFSWGEFNWGGSKNKKRNAQFQPRPAFHH